MRKLLLLLLPFAAVAQTETPFTIKGQFSGFSVSPQKVFISYSNGDERKSETVEVKDNQFVIEGKIAEPAMAMMTVMYGGKLKQSPTRDRVELFILPGENILIAKDSLVNAEMKGSTIQKEYLLFNKKMKDLDKEMMKYYELYEDFEKQKKTDSIEWMGEQLELIEAKRQNEVIAFVNANPSSPVSLYALNRLSGSDVDVAVIEPLFNNLPASLKTYPSAIKLKENIEELKRTAIGVIAPEFNQEDTSGNAVTLSSYKGKYVLVDFWASWCGPCRKENPAVVKAYNNYKDKGFTVLGVSLDDQKKNWIKAIHDDQLVWTNVSDLKGWENEVAKKYGVKGIPQNFLINPEGIIIAKNLRGKKLEEKLAEIFGK